MIVAVDDVDAARRFYTGVFGWTVTVTCPSTSSSRCPTACGSGSSLPIVWATATTRMDELESAVGKLLRRPSGC